ncbi:MAG TPA: hypothetical protein VJH68_05825 [Candidatus Nanoarchaeia archaeon]|nr:hypothetical protein [Candidatus Nanoarchaeia archaeon]
MIFPLFEVGSLPKLPGRKAKLAGREPTSEDLKQLRKALRGVDNNPELTAIVEEFLRTKAKAEIVAANSRFNTRLLEYLGLNEVYDGEAQRKEMYESVAEKVVGMKKLGRQVSFVNKDGFPNIFTVYSYQQALSLPEPLHLAETESIIQNALRPVKVPVTGAYTLGTWSDLGKLPAELMKLGAAHSEARKAVMEQLVLEFADIVINPTLKALSGLGVARIQIDEPNASAFYGQEELFYEATRRSIAHVTGPELGLHICFSNDYRQIAEIAAVSELKFLSLEIANRDTADHRAYQEIISAFEQAGFKGTYAVGVTDVHVDNLESPELIAERLLFAADLVGADRIEAAHDCGLRSRSLVVAIEKTKHLAQGTEIARQEYSS